MTTVEITTRTKAHRKTVRRKRLKMKTKSRALPRKKWAPSKRRHVYLLFLRYTCDRFGLLFSIDGGSGSWRAPASVQLHLLVFEAHPGETSQHSELWAEHQTDRQLCIGLWLLVTSLLGFAQAGGDAVCLSPSLDTFFICKLCWLILTQLSM